MEASTVSLFQRFQLNQRQHKSFDNCVTQFTLGTFESIYLVPGDLERLIKWVCTALRTVSASQPTFLATGDSRRWPIYVWSFIRYRAPQSEVGSAPVVWSVSPLVWLPDPIFWEEMQEQNTNPWLGTKLYSESVQDSLILFSMNRMVVSFLEGQGQEGELKVSPPEGSLILGATCESLPSHQVAVVVGRFSKLQKWWHLGWKHTRA